MRILLSHNRYQQPGGEDQSFAAEAAMLRDRGHEVIEYTAHNADVNGMNRVGLAIRAVWNPTTYSDLRRLFRRHRPQVAHFNNTFPLISPAAYYAARAEQIPVVQTLRNFRFLCANSFLFRDGRICHDCVSTTTAWPAVVHKCYRGSRPASVAVATMLTAHRSCGTWRTAIDSYIALTKFSRQTFVDAGFPGDRIVVKPNFVYPDPGAGTGAGGYALFVGRLSAEKGLHTLLRAWRELHVDLPLKIVGDGPEAPSVQAAATAYSGVEWLRYQPSHEVQRLLGDATLLVFPSEWYETFGRVAIEAFAQGVPVVASRLGAMAELVDEGRTGVCFEAGNPDDLVTAVRTLVCDSSRLRAMRCAARREYEDRYTMERNHDQLIGIYHGAIAARERRVTTH